MLDQKIDDRFAPGKRVLARGEEGVVERAELSRLGYIEYLVKLDNGKRSWLFAYQLEAIK